ncbi:MAG: 50S ribosomal protein L10 [Candidatus Dojkabacteria bacterium]|nr:MAG: 50S ribosomal protein L10 [Candidatus Dojkabacteria bacterium]
MAKNKNQKKEIIDYYTEKLQNAECIVVVKPERLTPNEVNNFRKKLYDFGGSFHVVKNTLFKIALKNAKLPEIDGLDNGMNAVMFTTEDYVNASKALKAFIEETKEEKDPRVKIVKGILNGELLEKDMVEQLADIPTVQGSVAMILGILDQAVAGVANVLQNSVQSYVSIIDQAFKDKN